ncbi:MAG: epoxyqueuosine reductase [Isosphaeraceae bacterium]|jgi:epoxyqueuosine reductase|nr:MAG: epoxyqueuosine reductase [Isosphaeraceae bacterium]
MRPDELVEALKAEARRLGFDAVGVAPAVEPAGYGWYRDWVERGCAAGMEYLVRQGEARRHPTSILDGVRSVVMTAIVYGCPDAAAEDNRTEAVRRGKVAQYARGADYHRVLWDRLERLLGWVRQHVPEVRGRAVVDTAPLLERDYARLAGLGWIGKNTMLIGRQTGSFTVLGALLLDVELTPDEPFSANHCGTCTRCLEACPTDAFDGPYRLDARRCLSYWTIEHRGPIPDAWAERLGGWVFGCDVCQDVCPWNRKAQRGSEPEFEPRPEWTSPDLVAWLEREPDEWARLLRGTALKRAKRAGLVRNAALVLGARGVAAARPVLERLAEDADAGVRAAAEWALRRIAESGSEEKPAPGRGAAG